MKYTIHAYKNAENSNPTEAINCSANWEIGHFTTTEPISLADVKGDTKNPEMAVCNALVESIYNMAEMFGYGDDVGMFITDDENGDFVAFAMHDKGTWVEPCHYCEGWCAIDPDHACDGFQGDIDGLDKGDDEQKTCPKCGGVMKFAMIPDSVGNGLHEGHECTDCGHDE